MPQVSVLMSNYNTPVAYLKRSIESVLAQTFDDFEIVIVNDGSVDASKQVLYDYAQKDSRIIIVENEKNMGLPRSLNRGIDACHGKYIARMDTDDICYPDRLQKQVAFMEAHPEYIVSGAWAEIFSKDENSINEVWKPKMCGSEEYRIRLLFSSAPLIIHPTAMFNKSLLDQFRIRYPEEPRYRYTEDFKMWIQCSTRAPLGILEDVVLKYRNEVSDSRITVRNQEQMSKCKFVIQQEMVKELGIELTDEWYPYHYQLLMGRKPYDIKFKNWIDIILKQNLKLQIYDQNVLLELLHDRWYSIVYYGIAYEKSVIKRLKFFMQLYPDGKSRFIKKIIGRV